jgi:hypothetical protein
MKIPFTDRWDRNYERMALAATAAAILILTGLVFSSAALQAASAIPEMWRFPPAVGVLRLWALALTAGAFFLAGAAFVCFTLTKGCPRPFRRTYALRLRIRNIGFVCAGAAFLLGILWIAVNIAIRFAT